jgi:hypothetical protein
MLWCGVWVGWVYICRLVYFSAILIPYKHLLILCLLITAAVLITRGRCAFEHEKFTELEALRVEELE